jgi:hypothetical protein
MVSEQVSSFDPEWASPADWARMYRAVGLQVVPARYPMRDRNDKRPSLADWVQFQQALVDDAVFERWFPSDAKSNMGAITGAASGNLLVIDLDDYKTPEAGLWFSQTMLGIEPETWTQRTGGGGRQLFFRLPEGVILGNCRTAIGVDFRGQGGFAMLPPSRHMSGKNYEWLEGREPWSIEIDIAPQHLIDGVRALMEENGGGQLPTAQRERTVAEQDHDAWGKLTDGREDYMRSVVWARVVDLRREAPMAPIGEALDREIAEAYGVYERAVSSNLSGPDPKSMKLEREGRGFTAFAEKFRYAMRQWDKKVAEAALIPKLVHVASEPTKPATSLAEGIEQATAKADPGDVFPTLSILDIANLPPPTWLVDNFIPEHGLSFIYGKPGKGKSFFTLDLALTIAHGMSWHGREAVQGGVLYVAGEGRGGYRNRVRGWHQHNGLDMDEAPFRLLPVAVNMMDAASVARLVRTIQASVQSARLVIIDTVARALPGAEENASKEMGLFVAACAAVQETCKVAVIGVHHSGKDEERGMRGSSALEGAGDCVVHLKREDDSQIITVAVEKQKDGEAIAPMTFELEKVEWLDGLKQATTLVPKPTAQAKKPADAMPSRDVIRAVLKEMDVAWNAKAPWSNKPRAKSEGHYAATLISRRHGVEMNAAERLVQELLDNEILAWGVADSVSKRAGLRVIKWDI